jgi:hypothetical protein
VAFVPVIGATNYAAAATITVNSTTIFVVLTTGYVDGGPSEVPDLLREALIQNGVAEDLIQSHQLGPSMQR